MSLTNFCVVPAALGLRQGVGVLPASPPRWQAPPGAAQPGRAFSVRLRHFENT